MAKPKIQCPAAPSDTGAYHISWEGPEEGSFRLVERPSAESKDGTLLYEGTEKASTITGREEGVYWYQVGLLVEEDSLLWSEPCQVRVEPPPLWLAAFLFSVGVLICLATVALIVRGHRAHRRGELG